MRLRPLLSAIVMVGAGLAGWFLFNTLPSVSAGQKGPAGKPGGPLPVEASAVSRGPLAVTLSTVGTLKANESLMLRPEVAGRITAISFEEGATVSKNTLLIRLDDQLVLAQLKQAEAALGLARVNYERAKMLKEKGAGTISQFDNAQAALRMAEAQRDLAQVAVDKTRIVAPFDGVMGLRKVSLGDVVNAGQELAGFQNITPIKVEFTLPENATRTVAVGQSVDLELDAFPQQHFSGSVYAIDPQINESNRSILLRALVPNEEKRLKPGLFAHITILTATKENALFVPEAAIVPRGTDSFVMRINAEHKIETVPLELGLRQQGKVEVISGLGEGDIVVTAGHLKLRDGMEVSVQ